MAQIVTFGEIMLRLAPPGVDRLQQALPGSLQAAFAGAEANTAVSLALLGVPVDFVTALPAGPVTEACLASLRSTGVGLQHVRQTTDGRLGIFFVETGANRARLRSGMTAQAPPSASLTPLTSTGPKSCRTPAGCTSPESHQPSHSPPQTAPSQPPELPLAWESRCRSILTSAPDSGAGTLTALHNNSPARLSDNSCPSSL